MIVDLAHTFDAENIVDLVIDETGDLKTDGGISSPLVVSLFSDRRAFSDEGIPDPLRRRGWQGSTIAGADPEHNWGSGLWFYEQARLSRDTLIGVRSECEASLAWMADEDIIATAVADVAADPATRKITITIDLTSPDGDITRVAYAIAAATEAGVLREY
jgi:phage gp46-like protein